MSFLFFYSKSQHHDGHHLWQHQKQKQHQLPSIFSTSFLVLVARFIEVVAIAAVSIVAAAASSSVASADIVVVILVHFFFC